MKTFIKIVALGATIATAIGTAQAQDTANGVVTANATVPNTCYIRSIDGITGTGSLVNGTAGTTSSATLSYANGLVDTATALSTSKTTALNVSAYCNYALAPVKLTSDNNGMVNTATTLTSGTFNKRVNYTASLSGWGTASNATLTTTGTATSNTAGAALVGTPVTAAEAVNTTNAVLQIVTTGSGTTPMLAGTYSDVLRVTFGPAS
jgi:hypothetical protein